MSKIKAVIFDWAGTTVDFGCFAPVAAFMESFKKHGIEVTEEETRKPMGMLKIDHIRTMLKMPRIAALWQEKYSREANDEDALAIYADFEPLLLASLNDYSTVKPYVLDIVQQLRAKDIKIGSTTGFNDKMMQIVTAAAAQQGYQPDFWISPDFTGNVGRPYPYMIFRNMYKLGIQSVSEVVKVGDTVADIMEGKNAGVWSVGVIDGSSVMGISQDKYDALSDGELLSLRTQVRKTLMEAGADFVINDLRQLPEVIRIIEKA